MSAGFPARQARRAHFDVSASACAAIRQLFQQGRSIDVGHAQILSWRCVSPSTLYDLCSLFPEQDLDFDSVPCMSQTYDQHIHETTSTSKRSVKQSIEDIDQRKKSIRIRDLSGNFCGGLLAVNGLSKTKD